MKRLLVLLFLVLLLAGCFQRDGNDDIGSYICTMPIRSRPSDGMARDFVALYFGPEYEFTVYVNDYTAIGPRGETIYVITGNYWRVNPQMASAK
jgi:hypothetical protein